MLSGALLCPKATLRSQDSFEGIMRYLAEIQHDPGWVWSSPFELHLDRLSTMRAQIAEPGPGRFPGRDLSSVQAVQRSRTLDASLHPHD